jgi:hypothetical protein
MKMISMVLRGEDLIETFNSGAEAEAFAIKMIRESDPFDYPITVMGVPEEEKDENHL